MTDDPMDEIFTALANQTRRRMLDVLRGEPGLSVGELCERFDMSRIGAMKHLHVLESSGLVVSAPDGRKRRLHVNAVPIQMIHDRWISEWSSLWAQELTALKYRVEGSARMSGQQHRNDKREEMTVER